MYIQRNLSHFLEKYLKNKEIHNDTLLIGGARQVGKSTLVKETLKGKKVVFVNLYEQATLPEKIDQVESFQDLERLLLREFNFKPSQGTALVIDEAQEAKRLGRWVRFFKEKWQNQKVILLGSILSNLFSEDIPYPVGRVLEIILRPYSFQEFLLATDRQGLREILNSTSLENPLTKEDHEALIKPYLEYLQIGGMPEIVKHFVEITQDIPHSWEQLLHQYAIDIERYMKENYRSLFIAATERIANHVCHPLKNSQILSTDSPSYRKLPKLLEVLEKWHLVLKVSAQTKQPESASGVASKRYLFDVGLTNHMLSQGSKINWQSRPEKENVIYGKLQENFVCCELINSKATPQSLKYYRETRNSCEIDFITSLSEKILPIEVKSQSSISKNSLIPMVHFLDYQGKQEGILVYNGRTQIVKYKGKTIYAIPPFYLNQIKNIF